MHRAMEPDKDKKQSFRVAILIGAGIMAAIDEIVFHQLLAWHHFYDLSTSDLALFSDGILHAAELIAIVAGFFFLQDLRRRHRFARQWAVPGFFVGAGGFQLFDGIVDHKILRVHQIRYGVENLIIYDLAWNGAALLLIFIGIVLARRAGFTDRQKVEKRNDT